jgi:hypothetical protein
VRPPKRPLILAIFGIWMLAVLAGLGWLTLYGREVGSQHAPHADGIAWLQTMRTSGRPLVAMAVHPRCPCSSASLSELGDLLARSRGACDAVLLEYAPPAPLRWSDPPAFRELGGIRVPVVADPEGHLADRLGAHSSGHAVFLDDEGVVRFHGGLTLSRGHRGKAPGQDAILAVLAGGDSATDQAPVYGCRLGGLTADCTTELCHAVR